MYCLKCGEYHVGACPKSSSGIKPLGGFEFKPYEPKMCTCTFHPSGRAGWASNPHGGGTWVHNDNCPVHGTRRGG